MIRGLCSGKCKHQELIRFRLLWHISSTIDCQGAYLLDPLAVKLSTGLPFWHLISENCLLLNFTVKSIHEFWPIKKSKWIQSGEELRIWMKQEGQHQSNKLMLKLGSTGWCSSCSRVENEVIPHCPDLQHITIYDNFHIGRHSQVLLKLLITWSERGAHYPGLAS
jgi:hypothetical protein